MHHTHVMRNREHIKDRHIRDEFEQLVTGLNGAGYLAGHELRYALAVSTGTQSVASGVVAVLRNLVPSEDPYDLVQVGGSIRIPVSGLYSVVGRVYWAVSAAGTIRAGYLYLNSAQLPPDYRFPVGAGGIGTSNYIPHLIRCVKGDMISLAGYQDSGGPLNAGGLPRFEQNLLSITFVRP
jgi:hypothetical protein